MRGKEEVYDTNTFVERDHPRLCGEKFQTFFYKVYIPGSPPPMRGKACQHLLPACQPGITPAYAGKSF